MIIIGFACLVLHMKYIIGENQNSKYKISKKQKTKKAIQYKYKWASALPLNTWKLNIYPIFDCFKIPKKCLCKFLNSYDNMTRKPDLFGLHFLKSDSLYLFRVDNFLISDISDF